MSRRHRRRQVSEQKPIADTGYYATLFVDVLNQRENIRRLETFPTEDRQKEAFFELVRESFGKVWKLKKVFEGIQTTRRLKVPDSAPPDIAEVIRRRASQKLNLRSQMFSDTVVVHTPVGGSGRRPLMDIYALLTAASSACLMMLADGAPIRGGFAINVGIATPEAVLYGPAAVEAYDLERCKAAWPRIAVGDSAIAYFRHCSEKVDLTAETRMRNLESAACLELITTEEDGVRFIDFLRPTENERNPEIRRSLIEEAFKFVNGETARFAGDPKLGPRYQSLRRYFENHSSSL